MTYAIYRRPDGTTVKYECREVQIEHHKNATRHGLFQGFKEVQPEADGEHFIRYEIER